AIAQCLPRESTPCKRHPSTLEGLGEEDIASPDRPLPLFQVEGLRLNRIIEPEFLRLHSRPIVDPRLAHSHQRLVDPLLRHRSIAMSALVPSNPQDIKPRDGLLYPLLSPDPRVYAL